jgi:hypothetical protein
MRYALVTFFVMASTVATVALAQDGGGRGPPKSPIIIMPQPTTLPMPASPTGSVQKFFQPKLGVASVK